MLRLIKSLFKSAGRGVRNDSELRKIISRYPRFFGFIKKRLTPDEKFGLHLTAGIFVTLFFIFIFYGILREYLQRDTIINADQSILNFVAAHRNPAINQIMLFVTYLGQGQVVALAVIFVCIILILRKHWYFFYATLISVLGGELFVTIIKNIIERPRPPITNALVSESTFSFPSGHSFVAVSFYGLLSYFLIRNARKKSTKFLCGFIGVLLILSIGFSRIYLGVHWTSDVLASYASGLAWISILITATRIKNPGSKTPYITKRKINILASLFFLMWIGFVTIFYQKHPLKNPAPISETKINISENLAQNLFKDISPYSETMFGQKIEPINFIIVGSQNEIEETFNQAKWLPLDTFNLQNLLVLSKRSIMKQSYPTAPGFPSFWNTKPNDLEFNRPTEKNSAQERFHIHLWTTQFLINNNPVWFGTTHFDGYQDTFLPIHSVDAALDSAREKLKDDLVGTGEVKSFVLAQVVKPTMGQNLFGSKFFTDGKAYILYLKDQN